MQPDKKIYFLSDFHLGAEYLDTHASERHITAFLDSIAKDAEKIFLLGDILDYWFEYRYAVPRGYVRFFGKLAELTDHGIEIIWLIGNHDIWIFDYLPTELGVKVIDGSVRTSLLGKNFFLTHGDGVGKRSAGFRFIRAMFRNRLCQKMYAAIHPRWSIPFAHRWSNHNRLEHDRCDNKFLGADEPLVQFAEADNLLHPETNFYIFGHRHVPGTCTLLSGAKVVQLGEWIHQYSYAVWDGNTIQLLRYD